MTGLHAFMAHLLARITVTLLVATLPLFATAHEVPNEVTVQSFVKPEGDGLTLLMRVPMSSLRDVDIPLDERGFLDLRRVDVPLANAAELWIRNFVNVYENGELLPHPQLMAARVSLPSDDTFDAGFEEALAHTIEETLPPDTEIYWEQGLLDLAYEYPIKSEASSFAIDPGLTRLGIQVNVILSYLAPDGVDRSFDLHARVGRVELDPSVSQAVVLFAKDGVRTVLRNRDVMLILFSLALPFFGWRSLSLLAVSFVAGQSIGVITAARGITPNSLWFPYLVQFLIAASILYLTVANIIGARIERHWRLAVFVGMLCGFALAEPLTGLAQFAGAHIAASVLGYAIAAGAAAFTALAMVMVVTRPIFQHVVERRPGMVVLSAFVAHSAWHLSVDRAGVLSQFPWPRLDALIASGALSWLTALVALACALWLSAGLRSERATARGVGSPAAKS